MSAPTLPKQVALIPSTARSSMSIRGIQTFHYLSLRKPSKSVLFTSTLFVSYKFYASFVQNTFMKVLKIAFREGEISPQIKVHESVRGGDETAKRFHEGWSFQQKINVFESCLIC